jgi:hypothetical protein
LTWTRESACECAKCRQRLEELLRKYNFFTLESDKDWTNKQCNEYSQQASTAFDIFRTLFRDNFEFSCQGSAEQQLDKSYNNDGNKDLVNSMVGWCESFFEDFAKDEGDGAGYTCCGGMTIEEMRQQSDPLTAPNFSIEESSLWPLVQKVSVSVPSSTMF